MPFADLPHVRIHYEISGDPSHPALVLSNSLGANLSMWDAQAPAFEKHFRLLRYEHAWTPQSSSPPPPYSVADLASDLLSLADFLAIERFHLCGLSIGGMIGITLALQNPARLQRLALCNTAAKIGTQESWNSRIETVRTKGMKEIARTTPARWFTTAFQSSSPAAVAETMQIIESHDPEGYIGGCCAVRDFDAREDVAEIRVPTLVISGTHDPAATPADGHFLADHIPGARYVELNAAHISSIEAADRLTEEVISFLS